MARFTEEDWKGVLSALSDVIGDASDAYVSDPEARLVAAIPYLAGSEDADRFSLSNLLTLHGSRKASAFFGFRTSDQDIFRRWATYHVGNQSEPRVVDFGLTLLALGSLAKFEKLASDDRKKGTPNPVTSGLWNPGLRAELEAELAKSPWLQDEFEKAVPALAR